MTGNLGSPCSPSHQKTVTLTDNRQSVQISPSQVVCLHSAAGSRKDNLVPELQKNRVRCDVRNLHVGDFLWVARENVKPLPGQLHPPLPRELVLDYVVERKRMDDLASSVKGSRFKEQKFRLKMSGLRKPIYLVEDFGSSAAHFCLPEATLQQAIVNTQKRLHCCTNHFLLLVVGTAEENIAQKDYQWCDCGSIEAWRHPVCALFCPDSADTFDMLQDLWVVRDKRRTTLAVSARQHNINPSEYVWTGFRRSLSSWECLLRKASPYYLF
uniref:Crossover junction endonuclease MUS81 n=1 Tax=Branchiostoma floridae TaxID=7739 RepID=C3Y0V4_BRAFL|eukprot:XP_002610077.1 hypothetical protein BRAFLDRAFT_89891 [Branchiostoma floridae]